MDSSTSDADAYFKLKVKVNPLKDQMKQNQGNYEIQLQVARYFKKTESYVKKPAVKLVSNNLLQVGNDTDELQVYFIYGENIPDISKK